MAYVKEYWNNKDERARIALIHTNEMENKYRNEILDCVKNTCLFNDFKVKTITDLHRQQIIVDDLDSVSAIFKYAEGRTAVLNFSSYKNPGGMFINGSKAQEECLCHESFLYNVLKEFQSSFYDWNNQHKNKALYLNRGLYSPDVVFEHNGKIKKCDVITCAAPNKSAAQKYQNVSDKENSDVLKSRIEFIMQMALNKKVDTLILGAYGCGVFGQDAKEVATIFKECIQYSNANKVIFAIPNGKDGNLKNFEKIFN